MSAVEGKRGYPETLPIGIENRTCIKITIDTELSLQVEALEELERGDGRLENLAGLIVEGDDCARGYDHVGGADGDLGIGRESTQE
ncbi:MAG: hypothetical protein HYR60_06360 [Acidobacteria bacterium]|nr:hypothetical protein [Acidobacteriota bacterium]